MMKVLCLLLLSVVLASAHPQGSETVVVETGEECSPNVQLHIHWDHGHGRGRGKGGRGGPRHEGAAAHEDHPHHESDEDGDDHSHDGDDREEAHLTEVVENDLDAHAELVESAESGEHQRGCGVHLHISSPEFMFPPEGTHYVYANCHLLADHDSGIHGDIILRQSVPFGDIEMKLNATNAAGDMHAHHVHVHEYGISNPDAKCGSVGDMYHRAKYSGDLGEHGFDDPAHVHNSDEATLIGRNSVLGRSLILLPHHEDGAEMDEHDGEIQACCTIIRSCSRNWEGLEHEHH